MATDPGLLDKGETMPEEQDSASRQRQRQGSLCGTWEVAERMAQGMRLYEECGDEIVLLDPAEELYLVPRGLGSLGTRSKVRSYVREGHERCGCTEPAFAPQGSTPGGSPARTFCEHIEAVIVLRESAEVAEMFAERGGELDWLWQELIEARDALREHEKSRSVLGRKGYKHKIDAFATARERYQDYKGPSRSRGVPGEALGVDR